VVREDGHTAARAVPVINNAYSLLEVADLVFIDAPGAGFSRIAGKDKEKGLLGRGQRFARVHAVHPAVPQQVRPMEFAEVPVRRELRHTRSAVLANELASSASIDLNGVILLSTILNFDSR
jgi:carboxypeptidase C (cathepsin A)